MKLRNKKTGEIVDTLCDKHAMGIAFGIDHHDGEPTVAYYNSLAELNEEWEDYEEPEEYWYISSTSVVLSAPKNCIDEYVRKKIGNYFETQEEAERAVEKLKALANLRKRGFKFNGWDSADRGLVGEFEIYCDAADLDGIEQELELVFGREEI